MTLRSDGSLASNVNNILVYLIGLGIVALVALSWNTSISIAEIKGSLDSFKTADVVNSQRIDKVEVHQTFQDKQIAILQQKVVADDRSPK